MKHCFVTCIYPFAKGGKWKRKERGIREGNSSLERVFMYSSHGKTVEPSRKNSGARVCVEMTAVSTSRLARAQTGSENIYPHPHTQGHSLYAYLTLISSK